MFTSSKKQRIARNFRMFRRQPFPVQSHLLVIGKINTKCILPVIYYAFSFLGSFFLTSCDKSALPISIECNGKEVVRIKEVTFEEIHRGEQHGMIGSVGIKVVEPNGASDCCEPTRPLRTWRQWLKPSHSYVIGSTTHEADKWVEEKFHGSANLRGCLPKADRPEESPFEQIFRDVPHNDLPVLDIEFVTCFGCVNREGNNFRPLACYNWGFENLYGSVDINMPEKLDLNEFRNMHLPQSSQHQNVPDNPTNCY